MNLINALLDFISQNIVFAGTISTVVTAGWAIITFYRNNLLKSAEILIKLEEQYSSHIDTLLELENFGTYQDKYQYKISLAISDQSSESKELICNEMKDLEAVLRYFFVCYCSRKLAINPIAIDNLCAYYLGKFIKIKKHDEGNYVELRDYIEKYWPKVYFWGEVVAEPLPKKIWLIFLQIPKRIRNWWSPTWSRKEAENQDKCIIKQRYEEQPQISD